MKKLISIALAIMLIMSLATVAFADDNGKITVENPVEGQTYTIYKILKLVTYQIDDPNTADIDEGAYIYRVETAWVPFFAGEGADYVEVFEVTDDYGSYVTWKGAKDDTRVAEFAKKALAWAEKNGIAATASQEASGTPTTVVFDGLELGYYLLDSSMGALCSLDTTNPTGTVREKNGLPQVEKKVINGDDWAESNTATIGDTVEFVVMITAKGGAENYVLHDTMESGLTFNDDVKVYEDYSNGEFKDEIPATDNYLVSGDGTHCTFKVAFTDAFTATLEDGDVIYVTYSATLNAEAEVYDDEESSNDNSVELNYGNDQKVEDEEDTKTYTYEFDLVKTDDSGNLLDGAKFLIYDAVTDGNVIKVKQDGDNYLVDPSVETSAYIAVKDGKVVVSGLGNGTYYLKETKAPDGYNALKTFKEFTIENGNLVANMDGDKYNNGGVQVVNKTGSELPETGAMGTAMFVSFGTLVVLGTGVLLVTKKRMSMIED